MADSICIITPDGIKCMSSPLKAHHHEKGCDDAATVKKLKPGLNEKDVDDFSQKLQMGSAHQKILKNSLLLLLQDDVKFDRPFTMVRMLDTR